MAMERWEQAQRRKGNIAGAEMARVLREQYGDILLPPVATPSEKSTPKIPESDMNSGLFTFEVV